MVPSGGSASGNESDIGETEGLTLADAVYAIGPAEMEQLSRGMIDDEGAEQALARALNAVQDGEIKYRGLADLIPQQVWTADPGGGLNYVNFRVCTYFGQTYESFLGTGWVSVLHPDDVEETLTTWEHSLQSGEPYEIEFRLRRADGVHRTHIGRAFPLRDPDGRIVRWFGTNTDMADEFERRRLAAIVEHSDDAIVGLRLDGTITSWNSGAEHLFGYSTMEALGRQAAMLEPPEQRGEVASLLERVGLGEPIKGLDTRRIGKSGRVVDVSLTVSPIRDEDGSIAGASAISRDNSERRRMERALAFQALQDQLTGLPNRVLLMDRLQQALEARERNGGDVAVLFVDLDEFKLINDSLGHSVGDEVLAAVAPRLRSLLRAGDTVARFGGDEFVVLLAASTVADAEALAGRIVDAFREPIEAGGSRHYVTASVGVAFAEEGMSAETVISNADAAMYHAKSAGRARQATFDRSFRERILRRVDMEAALRRAITVDELNLAYQPVVNLESDRVVGAEALLRWDAEDGDGAAPTQFIPVAEQSGLIIPIGERVLAEACAQGARWQTDAPGMQISVNVSARQLADFSFPESVEAALEASGLDPSLLSLEITESTLMEHARAAPALRRVRAMGVRVALDDFGTGYSSLAYLKRFPLDLLKIDRTFVIELGEEGSSAIVDAILHIAESFGLGVIGEGVEDSTQARYLGEAGCVNVQGFLFSPPVGTSGITSMLRDPDATAARFAAARGSA